MLNRARSIGLFLACTAMLAGCDDRAPESALYGTWQELGGEPGETLYYEFKPDHTLSLFMEGLSNTDIEKGKWYAGGRNIYLHYPEEVAGDKRPVIWHIVDISKSELRIRFWRNGGIITFKRVKLASLATRI